MSLFLSLFNKEDVRKSQESGCLTLHSPYPCVKGIQHFTRILILSKVKSNAPVYLQRTSTTRLLFVAFLLLALLAWGGFLCVFLSLMLQLGIPLLRRVSPEKHRKSKSKTNQGYFLPCRCCLLFAFDGIQWGSGWVRRPNCDMFPDYTVYSNKAE